MFLAVLRRHRQHRVFNQVLQPHLLFQVLGFRDPFVNRLLPLQVLWIGRWLGEAVGLLQFSGPEHLRVHINHWLNLSWLLLKRRFFSCTSRLGELVRREIKRC